MEDSYRSMRYSKYTDATTCSRRQVRPFEQFKVCKEELKREELFFKNDIVNKLRRLQHSQLADKQNRDTNLLRSGQYSSRKELFSRIKALEQRLQQRDRECTALRQQNDNLRQTVRNQSVLIDIIQ